MHPTDQCRSLSFTDGAVSRLLFDVGPRLHGVTHAKTEKNAHAIWVKRKKVTTKITAAVESFLIQTYTS